MMNVIINKLVFWFVTTCGLTREYQSSGAATLC